jgi:response regulator NasT
MRSLLLVEDDRLILSTLTSGLARAGYRVSTAESVDEAEAWLENNERPDLVILDVQMPGRSGLELPKRLSELHHIPFILLTAHSEQEVIAQATTSGAMGYMVKPVDITQLIPAIETALSRAHEFQDLRGEKQQLQTALDADRIISVAVGITMDQRGIGRNGALELLRKTARSQHIKLVELASRIVDSRETLNLENDT